MNIYMDLDCLAKLLACDAFDSALIALGCSRKDVYILDRFKYTAKSKAAKYKKAGEKDLAFIYESIYNGLSITGVKQIAVLSELVEGAQDLVCRAPGIDIGEALLMYAAANDPAAGMLATGDKNFLRALSSLDSVPANLYRLKNKLIHLEDIIYILLSSSRGRKSLAGFKTARAADSDQVITIIFRSDDCEEILASLRSYRKSFYSPEWLVDLAT